MSVYLCIPSARPPIDAAKILRKWRDQGYHLAIWRDEMEDFWDLCKYYGLDVDVAMFGKYPGYASAVNRLVSIVLENDPTCEWVVAGGDDTEPDMNHTADEIAGQLTAHFNGTFGVCQPTGDRFAGGCIDRICGSPWMGREFCRRVYGGRGPLWPEFYHMFVDEHLQAVAQKLGILWQRPDLIHLHRHFTRGSDALNAPAIGVREGGQDLYGADKKPRPAFLDVANSGKHWQESEAIFNRLRAGGFAEAFDLLPMATQLRCARK